MREPTDARLTSRIIVDSGQWAKGKTLALARAAFKDIHSGRNLSKAQVWVVTPKTTITGDGRFTCPRASYVPPERIDAGALP